jgi:thiol-disulfide isomerase/thioredoxin
MRAPITRRLLVLGSCLFLLAVSGALLHQRITRFLVATLLLRSPNPAEEAFEQVTATLPDPTSFLERCWGTGKVPHRQLVASFLLHQSTAKPPWFDRVRPILRQAATDPDMSLRELALAALQSSSDPHLFEVAEAQLDDPDPLIRLLGLDHLRRLDPKQAVPKVLTLLDDRDLRVVAGAEVALVRWTGQDFGVRTHLAIPAAENGRELDPAHAEQIRRGVELRKQWWRAHAGEFAEPTLAVAKEKPGRPIGPRADDFTLLDLEGKPVRLAQFRGKPVLLNFWATWCTACLAEIPDLIALHKKLGDRVVILGIALDAVRDEHGHSPGVESHEHQRSETAARKVALSKILRAVQTRGINYPVLWDPDAAVACRFNGGELPTTVILDSQGRLRRRFIGERSLEVFEAMLAEAER